MKTSLQKLKKKVLTLGLASVTLSGVYAQCATSTIITGITNGTVDIMNQSSFNVLNGSAINVNFGDGSAAYNASGTNFTTSHTYTNNGMYFIQTTLWSSNPLDSSNSCYTSDLDTVVITGLTPACNLLVGVNTYNTGQYTALLSGYANNSYTYSYLTVDGNIYPNTDSMFYTFPAAGAYNVCYYAEDSTQANYCYDSACVIYTVQGNTPVQCNASFYIWEDSVNVGTWYGINNSTGNGPLTYMWDFGDGTTSNSAYPAHSYATAGNYVICLSIISADSCFSSTCDSSAAFRMIQQQFSTTSMIGSLSISAPAVSIKENKSVLAETKVFPNPMTESAAVTFNSSVSANGKMEIVSVLGAVVLSENVVIAKGNNEFKMNTSSLVSGLYYINIVSEGKTLGTIKTVK
jgi:PKD domain/Secretion system C-terminal sorting domain